MPDLKTLRPIYVEKYGKDAWTRAVALAARHRARASTKYGQAEHFSAWEWLDLCGQTDFRCFRCGEKLHLEAHHRIALVRRGPNTIENIEPVCDACHDLIPRPIPYPKDVSEAWTQEQNAAYSKCPSIGTLVRPIVWQAVNHAIGVVTRATAPFLEPGPLWGDVFEDGSVLVFRDNILEFRGCPSGQPRYEYPLVYVLWAGEEVPTAIGMSSVAAVNVTTAKMEALAWLQRSETVLAAWHIGDKVRTRSRSSYRPNRGEIERIIPHKALPLTGFTDENKTPLLPVEWVPHLAAKALVRWHYPDGKSKVTRVEISSLVRLGASGKSVLEPKDETLSPVTLFARSPAGEPPCSYSREEQTNQL